MKTIQFLITVCLLIVSHNTVKAQLIFDTITQFMAGPGTQVTLIQEVTKPWNIQVMEIDLTNQYIGIETVKAKDNLIGLEKTSSMALRKTIAGHKVIGAINGDFFSSTGTPINTQIINGEILRESILRSTLGVTNTNIPLIQIGSVSGTVISKNSSYPIQNFNSTRGTNQLILFNTYIGTGTKTNNFGSEWICTPISNWIINDTVWVKATQLYKNQGNTALSEGTFVLSGHGTAESFLTNQIAQGDTIGLLLNYGDPAKKTYNLIGGYPQIIKNGANYVDEGYAIENGPSHTYERHPRTAVGFSSDETKLYLVTVDGRQARSIGITLPELADFMLTMDMYQGINLDGGGSTTMIANDKIINFPSDYSGERSVANALMVISSAPQGNLQQIQIQLSQLKIRYGAYQQFNLTIYDEYNNPLPYNTNDVQWNISSKLGILNESGIFWANGTESIGYIYASYQNLTDSCLITILPIEEFTLNPSVISTDSILPVNFEAVAQNVNTTLFTIDPNLLTWSVTDTLVGTITQPGVFKGLTNGIAQVIATVGNVQAMAQVNVEIFNQTELLDNFDTESWSVTSSFFDSLTVSTSLQNLTEGTGSYKIDYQFTYQNRSPYFTLFKEIPVPGIPDSIWLDTKLDEKEYRVSYNLATNSNFNNFTFSNFVSHNSFKAVGAGLNIKPLTDYPYIVKELKIEIWKNESYELGKTYKGVIYIDNLRVSYPGHAPIFSTFIHQMNSTPGSFTVFPNPSSGYVTLYLSSEFTVKNTEIEVYTMDGKKIPIRFDKTGNNVYSTHENNLPKGIYIVCINNKKFQKTGKLIIE